MSWQLGLSRFIHGLALVGEPARAREQPRSQTKPPGLAPVCAFSIEREEQLLPALISALFDFEGSYGAWPPRRVKELLELAGLDRITGGQHLRGPNFRPSFNGGPRCRGLRQTVLLEGLAALDKGLLAETGSTFEELSPLLRGYVLGAFERGDMGFSRAGAERFMDCLVETVTFAFLNFELGLTPLQEDAPEGGHAS
jgi:hypothetical protein